MPRGLRNYHFSFDAGGLTRFGGLTLFQHFCKNIGLRYFLQHQIKWPEYSQKQYHPADIFLTHMYAIIAGIGRVQNTQSLASNGLLPNLLGLPEIPHRDTLRDFLRRFTPQSFRSMESAHDRIRKELFDRLGPVYSSTIDMDTTVLTVYGKQEGSAIGYNPTHRGKKSFCPLLVSEGKLGLTMNFDFRSGSVSPSTGTVLLLKETLEKLPQTIAATRTRIRADSVFYDKDFVQYLDDNQLKYVIVAKKTSPVQKILPGVRFREFQENWSCGEFRYQPGPWARKHRFIAIRSLVKETDTPDTLFAIKDYSYRVLVTNLQLQPEKVWKFYCNRALQELLIRELKSNFAMAKIPTNSFIANQAYMEIALMSHDLVMAFKRFCLPAECQKWSLPTLRRNLFVLPAELVHPGHYNKIRLPKKFPFQDIFLYAQRAATKVKPII